MMELTMWRNVNEADSFGIAIYNFNDEEPFKLKLVVGDAVRILHEETDWYHGYVINNCHLLGIFPKSYIHIKQCQRFEGGLPIFKAPSICQEITSTLREWGGHWKNLYTTHNKAFEEVKNRIYDLIVLRNKIISGTLPIDEIRRVTKQSAQEIDLGNRILGLDLVVRDKSGNVIDSEVTSTIQLFNYHKDATERINNRNSKSGEKDDQPKSAIQQFSNIFLVSVKNFTYKISEDSELLMCLYDAKEFKPITESYVVRWTKEGLMSDLDQMYNLRVMFTDLGKKDLEREKIYLVCYVIRIGLMEVKEIDHRRSSLSVTSKKTSYENMRRPCGVAAMDVTGYMHSKFDTDLEKEFAIPFISCEKDNLDQVLRKIITKEKMEHKNPALIVSMKLLRGDLKRVREENPHLVLGNVSRARKMGFPEVILPGDVRNDLYLTLVNGEFSKGSKTSEKNVEVVVKVCNEKGQPIPGVISLGGGVPEVDEYRSVIYYHEDKPQWHETIKVALTIDEFKSSHLKFTFKHRSSNEAKDKSEKPFAMSYVKLMQDNGVTLSDALHGLIVFKIDYKRFDENGLDYFKLPCFVSEMKESNCKPQAAGLTASTKDSFNISSNICSTKLTQNVNLLGLLNWASHKDSIHLSLQNFMYVEGEEIVKFLQDILDALFNILMDDPDSNKYDVPVFESLLRIITLVTNDWKYLHFEPVLDLYIREGFSATLAYTKLISILKLVISKASYSNRVDATKDNLIFRTLKAFQYIMRFISRSRILYLEVYPDINTGDEFDESIRELLRDIIYLMSSGNDQVLREQGACLKYLPNTIPDMLLIFDKCEISNIFCEMLNSIPPGRLTKQKIMTINDIVHSKLCLYPQCRQIIIPFICNQVKLLLETGEEVELCIKVLCDILVLLFRKDIGPTHQDISEVIHTNLRTVIQCHIKMERENSNSGHMASVMLDIFRQMTTNHYEEYLEKFTTDFDKLDFLMEILVVFKELVSSNSVFPKDWYDMIMLQNSIILKSLRFFSHTIRDRFFKRFEHDAWNNFFYCAIAFMTQDALQLENFSSNKRIRIINRYSDMRREMGFEVRSMWFNLGLHKVQFVPSLVGIILEMTLIPESELRTHTIPIFFDMMQCEFYSSKLELESFGDTKRDSSHIKGNFNDFENEMIVKLDALFEGGKGDYEYKELFFNIMKELCEKHTTLKEDGIKFVTIVSRLMDSLLDYRNIISNEHKDSIMSCTVNLLDFYSEIDKKEMYIRYLNKLYDLHIDCDNYTEAAFTLELHTKLLKWSDEVLSPLLKGDKYLIAKSHRELKEALYYKIIDNYSKGKMWEYAISKCKELAEQYEQETFDYERLGELHMKLAGFYDCIMKHARPEPEYFRVGYYGKGFPLFLQNKVFIYRGKEYERLEDFNSRIVNEFPKAVLLNKLDTPGTDITGSDKQYIQINKVDPVMEEKNQRFSGKAVCDQIVRFYKVNNIKKFSFSRRFTRKDPFVETNNEFAHMWLEKTELETTYPLPGILRWFLVEKTALKEISPLRNAIETLDKSNKDLFDFISMFNKDKSMPINLLSMRLNGILDAAVMGGTKNYEEVFFSDGYLTHHADDVFLVNRLKDLIADQIPLLELCLQIHKQKVPANLQPLQQRMEDCFVIMKDEVEKKYGKGNCSIKLAPEVQMRRHYSITSDTRLSDVTITPDQPSPFQSYSKGLVVSPSKSVSSTPSLNNRKSSRLSKRRRSKTETVSVTSPTASGALWYTSEDPFSSITSTASGPATPPIELTQELYPTRPLRSEVEKEKRLSRPTSGQFSRPGSVNLQIRGTNNSSGTSSNRDSMGTTDSNISEEDSGPPPLPVKHKDSINDFSNLAINENTSFLHSRSSSLSRHSYQSTLEATAGNGEREDLNNRPPSPPPKPPKTKHIK